MQCEADRWVDLGAMLASQPYASRGVAMSTETISVMVVDDHAIVREGLRLVLRAASDIAVIGEAEDGDAAVALAQRLRPNVLLLDLDMPRTSGAAVLEELGRTLPDVRVLILTMHAERDRLLPLLSSGARGYLTKDAASRELIEAIRVVAGGEVYVRPAAARVLAAAVVPQAKVETARGRFETLSDREQTVIRLVAQGYSGAEISRQLRISTKTVDAYKRRVQQKLGLGHRTDYVRFALEVGILAPPRSATSLRARE
jgi:DNA-binding NarL/FixJ family response regulator